MKKYSLLLSLIFYTHSLYASEDNMFSATFIENLAACKSYEENRTYYFQDIRHEDTYKIAGKRDDECLMEIHSQNPGGARTLQTCRFDSDDLEEYIAAAKSILDKKKPQNFSEAWEEAIGKEALELSILQDIHCRVTREAYDPTANIRPKLAQCQSAKEIQKAANRTEFVRQIVGKDGENCRYILEVWKRAPKVEHYHGEDAEEWKKLLSDVQDRQTVYECTLDQEQIKKLESAQEKLILPAYDSQNETDENQSNFDPAAELDFVNENCNRSQNWVKPDTDR